MSTYVALAHAEAINLVDDDEEVIPGNIGALKKGFQALLKEDAQDDGSADLKWAAGVALLVKESETEHGAAAEGTVSVEDDFQMSRVSGRFAWGYDGYGSGWGYGG